MTGSFDNIKLHYNLLNNIYDVKNHETRHEGEMIL